MLRPGETSHHSLHDFPQSKYLANFLGKNRHFLVKAHCSTFHAIMARTLINLNDPVKISCNYCKSQILAC